jgi:hypothetical protein
MYEDANYQIITNVLTDNVYLDTLERRKFAQSSHEYLIDVVQNHFDYANNSEYRSVIEYVNAVKEIIWIVQRQSLLENPDGTNECRWTEYSHYPDSEQQPFINSTITINGNNLLNPQSGNYFNYVVPYNCHTRTPKTGISCYSFCLNPAEVQPSGSCNLSRITITQIIMNFDDKMLFEINNPNAPETLQIKVFGLSMNILRIFDGMGALAFV